MFISKMVYIIRKLQYLRKGSWGGGGGEGGAQALQHHENPGKIGLTTNAMLSS